MNTFLLRALIFSLQHRQILNFARAKKKHTETKWSDGKNEENINATETMSSYSCEISIEAMENGSKNVSLSENTVC